MNSIQNLRNRIEREKGRRDTIRDSLDKATKEAREIRKDMRRHEQAREIIREVGLKTQQQLQYHISDIASLALEAVFDNPYELIAEFVQRRNKTECDLYFQRDEKRYDPLEASGYGAVDVASLALRIVAWSMQVPRKRNTIILDEPLRFLSQDRQEQASRMIKELSDRLGLQFIIITHEATLTEFADKTFQVSIRNGISKIV